MCCNLRVVLALCASVVLAIPVPVQHDLEVDVPATVGLVAGWLLTETALKPQLAPAHCRWCARNGLDDAARAVRAPLEHQRSASLTSDLLGLVALPLTLVGLDALLTAQADGRAADALLDVLLIIEAVSTYQAINQTVKFVTARERPFVAQLPEPDKPFTRRPDDNNLSFFSGHTGFAFSVTAATATVLRARGHRAWWVALAVGLPLALATGVLRMAADQHYLTDVLTATAVGALTGFALPALFHRPLAVGPAKVSLAAGPGAITLTAQW